MNIFCFFQKKIEKKDNVHFFFDYILFSLNNLEKKNKI